MPAAAGADPRPEQHGALVLLWGPSPMLLCRDGKPVCGAGGPQPPGCCWGSRLNCGGRKSGQWAGGGHRPRRDILAGQVQLPGLRAVGHATPLGS